MEQTNILRAISDLYPQLTKSSKKVADYILKNPQEAQYMSITTLAEVCGVADATVSRFCRALGFSGYSEFKIRLVKDEPAEASNNRMGLSGKISMSDSLGDLCKKLYTAEVEALSQTLADLEEEQLHGAVNLLRRARQVFCIGYGGSMVMAMEAVARFATVTNTFRHVSDLHLQTMALSLAGPEDVVLLFSYSGTTKDIFDALKIARDRGTRVILVTHFPRSPAAAFSDINLVCGAKESPVAAGSISAKIGILYIIDILYNEYCRKCAKEAEKNLSSTAYAVAMRQL